jgi:hypothetical protein
MVYASQTTEYLSGNAYSCLFTNNQLCYMLKPQNFTTIDTETEAILFCINVCRK